MEALEDRVTPTVFFTPQLGAETLLRDNGDRMDRPPVFVIFWGDYWSTHQSEAANYLASTQQLIASPYFSGLDPYYSGGKLPRPTWGVADLAGGQFTQNFTEDDLFNMVVSRVNDSSSPIPRPTTPAHTPIYVVVTPPDVLSTTEHAIGWNTKRATEGPSLFFYLAWISTTSHGSPSAKQDYFSEILSHEMAESFTDPGGNGIEFNHGTDFPADIDASNQVSDAEAQSYTYRVDGVLTQSYWSATDGKYKVEDGNNQVLTVDNKKLIINGDQGGPNTVDHVYIRDDGFRVVVTLNAENYEFADSAVSSIEVNSGGGADDIELYSLGSHRSATIRSSGPATVIVGNGDLDGIRGPVKIVNNTNTPDTVIADGQFGNNDTVSLDRFFQPGDAFPSARLTTASNGTIVFNSSDVSTLTIKTGPAGSTVNVNGTAVTTFVEGHGANTHVNVGSNGLLQDIVGDLIVTNPPNLTAVVLDDSVDGADHSAVVLDAVTRSDSRVYQKISGLTVGNIYLSASDVRPVAIKTGVGTNAINVRRLLVPVTLEGAGDSTSVVAGNAGQLNGIAATLSITNPTSRTGVTIDDSADSSTNTVVLDTYQPPGVFGSDGMVTATSMPGTIYFDYLDTSSATIRTGIGTNIVDVREVHVPTTVDGNSNDTTVNVGSDHTLLGVFQDLTITNRPAFTHVFIDDSADPYSHAGSSAAALDNVTLSDGQKYGQLSGLALGNIRFRYDDLRDVTIASGTGALEMNIRGIGVTTEIDAHGSDPAFNFGDSGKLDGISGLLTLTDPGGYATINVDDSADETLHHTALTTFLGSDNYTYGEIGDLAPGTIRYKYGDTRAITIATGTAANTVHVRATSAPTTIEPHSLGTTVNVGDAGRLDNIASDLTIGGIAFGGVAVVDDSAATQAHDVTIGSQVDSHGSAIEVIGSLSRGTIALRNGRVVDVSLLLGSPSTGRNTVTVADSTPDGPGLDLHGTRSGEVARIEGNHGRVTARFFSTVAIGAGGLVSTLNGGLATYDDQDVSIDDSHDPNPQTGTVTDTTVEGFPGSIGGPWLTYAGLGSLKILGGASSGNTFIVPGTAAMTGGTSLLAGSGNDTIVAGTVSGGLSGFLGPLSVDGQAGTNTLQVAGGTNRWEISGPDSGSVGPISFVSIQNLAGGAGDDRFVFEPGGSISGNIDGGGGSNGLDYSAITTPVALNLQASTATAIGGTFSNVNGFVGGSGPNQFTAPDSANVWTITGADSGTLNNFAFHSFPTLTGGAGDDRIVIQAGASLSGSIDGGAGANTLDYAQYVGDIVVNLLLGRATAIGGSVRRVQNVTAGTGNAMLVGSAQPNVLKGGTGRSFIIGGLGSDQIQGGGGDAILIGGTTSFDADPVALAALMAEWTRADLSFEKRLEHLMTGNNGALNGRYTLSKKTVVSDGASNDLTGAGGTTWFFVNQDTDTIKKRKPQDHTTTI